jgi:Tfp pilus assembly ATPase PilU
MERDQASKFINDLLQLMVNRKGSDLFLTAEFPPAIKVDGAVARVSPQPLSPNHTMALARSIMSDRQMAEFERTKECNFAISPAGIGRFRVNAFIQQGRVGMVLRTIPADIPTIDQLGLPQVLTVAANTTGGVTGKMISPQSIAIACAAVGLAGKESDLFRFTVKHSLMFATMVGIITYVQAYYLTWMIPQ